MGAIVLSWMIWAGVVAAGCMTEVNQFILALLFLIGFAPYLASMHVIEPWLERKQHVSR